MQDDVVDMTDRRSVVATETGRQAGHKVVVTADASRLMTELEIHTVILSALLLALALHPLPAGNFTFGG